MTAPAPRLVGLALLAVGALAAPTCSIDAVDLGGKRCPCAAGWTCAIDLDRCVQASIPPDVDAGCCIYTDSRLYCANTPGAAMYASPALTGAVVNHLQTPYSWFTCWDAGELHSGGNTTWYYTLGDDTATWGWVPADDLETPDTFDADPSAMGLPRCGR